MDIRVLIVAFFTLSLAACGASFTDLAQARLDAQRAFSKDPCLNDALPRCHEGEPPQACSARFEKAWEDRDAICADRATRKLQEDRQINP